VHDSGPIGEHVRTFIVGDNLAETVASLKERIDALRHERPDYHRHHDGAQVGVDKAGIPMLPHTANS
jgi:hypothetical protein